MTNPYALYELHVHTYSSSLRRSLPCVMELRERATSPGTSGTHTGCGVLPTWVRFFWVGALWASAAGTQREQWRSWTQVRAAQRGRAHRGKNAYAGNADRGDIAVTRAPPLRDYLVCFPVPGACAVLHRLCTNWFRAPPPCWRLSRPRFVPSVVCAPIFLVLQRYMFVPNLLRVGLAGVLPHKANSCNTRSCGSES